MRTNANAPVLPDWPEALLSRIVRAENLAFARLEPVFTRRDQGGFGLDLVFSVGNEIAVIPAIRIAHEMLLEAESSPLLWPACALAVPEERIDAIERLVVPWLQTEIMVAQVNGERVRWFSSSLTGAEFDRARAWNFAGAARYRDVAIALSPYAYAQRFADRASVGIRDSAGSTGAALLASCASAVRCDLQNTGANEFATRWFGRTIYGHAEDTCEVGIGVSATQTEIRFDETGAYVVRVATPVPTELFVSFDPEDSPVCRSFSVTCKQRAEMQDAGFPVPAAIGGSSGRILFVMRDVAAAQRGAEGDDASELASRLRAEGFTVDTVSPASHFDLPSYDLVHAFDFTEAVDIAPVLEESRKHNIPVAATPGLTGISAEMVWATRLTETLMRTAQDETTLSDHLEMMALRRLLTDDSNPVRQEPVRGYTDSVRRALACVDALLVSSPQEEALARERFGYRGPIRTVRAYLGADAPSEPVDEICGNRDFIFAHTAIVTPANLPMLARAARLQQLPLLVAGAVSDAVHFATLRESLDRTTMLLPNPSPGQLASLYRRARVFADLGWWQPSLHRVARAIVRGCSVLVAADSHAASLWPNLVSAADCVDVKAIERGLTEAWSRPADPVFRAAVAAECDPGATLRETVTAYALAQSAKQAA